MESKLLYHITDYRNLSSILRAGELLAYSQMAEGQKDYADIAHGNIQNRRSAAKVPVSPCGSVHDYVPFYFAPRSPMLYALKRGRVEGFTGTQSDIIYLVTSIGNIAAAGKSFVFTDGHAVMALTDFYNDLEYLKEVDWAVMESKYWNDTDEFPDRKRRRQAEFLVHKSLPLEWFLGIGVRDERMKQVVDGVLAQYETEMPVLVRPSFYF